MVVTNHERSQTTALSYASSLSIANEWYSEKIQDNRTALIKMDQPFSIKEHEN
jgi:hypothetical protein